MRIFSSSSGWQHAAPHAPNPAYTADSLHSKAVTQVELGVVRAFVLEELIDDFVDEVIVIQDVHSKRLYACSFKSHAMHIIAGVDKERGREMVLFKFEGRPVIIYLGCKEG